MQLWFATEILITSSHEAVNWKLAIGCNWVLPLEMKERGTQKKPGYPPKKNTIYWCRGASIIYMCKYIYKQYIPKYHWISSRLGSSNIIQTHPRLEPTSLGGRFQPLGFGETVRPSIHPRYVSFVCIYIYISYVLYII